MESNNSGIAKVDCVHADKENKPKDCLDWLNTHEYCNGCPAMMSNDCPDIGPVPDEVKYRGHAELALELELLRERPLPTVTKRFLTTYDTLNEKPMEVRKQIVDYLAPHMDKISNIEVELEFPEETMTSVVVVLRMFAFNFKHDNVLDAKRKLLLNLVKMK